MTDNSEKQADRTGQAGFRDCRGEWQSIGDEPTTMEASLEPRC